MLDLYRFLNAEAARKGRLAANFIRADRGSSYVRTARHQPAVNPRAEVRANLSAPQSSDIIQACRARIEAREDAIAAWTVLDWAYVDRQLGDSAPLAVEARGPISLGLKDLFDTAGLPTAYDSANYAGFRPVADAACVTWLKAARAIILGKTVTT